MLTSIFQCFVRSFNLDDFLRKLSTASLQGDIQWQMLRPAVPEPHYGLGLAMPHLDMRYPLRTFGYRDELKACKKRLGFQRRHSDGVDGAEAVYLWHAWRRNNDKEALRNLVLYNMENTFSLAWLAAKILPHSMPEHPIHDPTSTLPTPPAPTKKLA